MTIIHPERNFSDALESVGDVVPQRVAPTLELGATGLRRTAGYVDEEFLPQLRGRKAIGVFREMSDNDPIVGALLFGLERLLRQVDGRVEPASDSPDDKKAAEFVEQCMEDMSHTWDDLISEILTMLTYGWSWHEIVYKRRVGPWEKDATKRSKFTDGKIGWRKMPIRSQDTLQRWVFDDTGGVQAMVQMAPPYYKNVVLPISKSLLFRPTLHKGSPEGRSVLRNAYRPWYMKKRLEEIEAIGVERDLAGMPVGKVPADYLTAKPGTEQAKMVDAFRKMVKSVRRDEQEGIVLPAAFDQDTKMPLFDFELLSSGGTRQFDTSGIIQRYEQRILMTVLADFILVGHESTGSYAMHTDKTGLFRTAINSFAQAIADVFNRHALPRLFALNAWKPEGLPKIIPNDVDPPDLTQLGAFMGQMAQAGVVWFPDVELEKFIRKAARLPELSEQTEAELELESRQADIMRIAQQRMEMLNLQVQAQQGQVQMQQSQMGLAQQQMGIEQQKRELEAPATDPALQQSRDDELHQMTLAEKQQAMAQRDEDHKFKLKAAEDTHKLKLNAEGERTKLTLQQLRDRAKAQAQAKSKPPAKGPARKPPPRRGR